jgi:hypothetical protein
MISTDFILNRLVTTDEYNRRPIRMVQKMMRWMAFHRLLVLVLYRTCQAAKTLQNLVTD